MFHVIDLETRILKARILEKPRDIPRAEIACYKKVSPQKTK